VDSTNSDVVFVGSDQGVFVRPAWVTTSIVAVFFGGRGYGKKRAAIQRKVFRYQC
jgi:hypothetical protein